MLTRRMTDADAEGVRRVALETGQPPEGSAADPAYRSHVRSRGYVAVAVDDAGSIVGYSAAVPIGDASLLTDLFVDPLRHGEGIGRSLLDAVWPPGDRVTPRLTFSSQHRHALSLYLRTGLAPIWPLLYLSGSPRQAADAGPAGASLEVERVSPAVAAAAERDLTGVDRAADYEYLTRGDPAGGLLVLDRCEVVGAAVVRPGHVEHLVCADTDLAAPVLIAALGGLADSEIRVCLPGPHPAVPVLLDRWFRISDFDLYMATGPEFLPPIVALSPAFA
jgi:GNAT superfamily N-acetyltransferase